MRILATVFAHTRYVAFNVAWIQRRFIERWIEQLNQRMLAPHETLIDSFHCLQSSLRVCCPRQNGPALRNRIDLTFEVASRAKWLASVEISAPIPGAIPSIVFDVL